VDVEKYAYYVNKLRQNVGLETGKLRQIVTSQTAHTKCKWPPYDLEPNTPMKIFCVRHRSIRRNNCSMWHVFDHNIFYDYLYGKPSLFVTEKSTTLSDIHKKIW